MGAKSVFYQSRNKQHIHANNTDTTCEQVKCPEVKGSSPENVKETTGTSNNPTLILRDWEGGESDCYNSFTAHHHICLL